MLSARKKNGLRTKKFVPRLKKQNQLNFPELDKYDRVFFAAHGEATAGNPATTAGNPAKVGANPAAVGGKGAKERSGVGTARASVGGIPTAAARK